MSVLVLACHPDRETVREECPGYASAVTLRDSYRAKGYAATIIESVSDYRSRHTQEGKKT